MSDAVILGAAAAAVAAGVGAAYLITRGDDKQTTAPRTVYLPPTRSEYPAGMAPLPVSQAQSVYQPYVPPPVNSDADAWLKYGSGALASLPTLVKSFGDLATALSAQPSAVVSAQESYEASHDYSNEWLDEDGFLLS